MSAAARRWLVVIVVAGAALRFYGLAFGLPYPQARPDEETSIGKALEILGGDPNPRFFHWPSLAIYLFAGILWIGQTLHDLAAPARGLTFSERALLARGVIALAGTATILVLFDLARRVAGERIALLASALLAVSILHVRESHFATTDALATLFAWCSLAFLVRSVGPAFGSGASTSGVSPADIALAGFAAGLATSAKYSAAFVALSMAAVQILLFVRDPHRTRSPRGWLPLILFGATMGSGFLMTTPYALLDYGTFSRDFLFDLEHLSEAHRGILLGRGWTNHFTRSLPYGVGLPVFIAALAGVVPFVRHHGRAAFVLGAFAVPFYLVIGSGYTVFFRYVLPFVPLVCLSAAIGISHAASSLAHLLSDVRFSFGRTPARAVIFTALVAITLGPSLFQSIRFDAVLARTDTRVLAGAWLESRIRPEETLYDSGSSYTGLDLWRARFKRLGYDERAGAFMAAGSATRDSGVAMPDWLVLYASPLWTYAATPTPLRDLATSEYVPVHEERSTAPTSDGSPVYDLQDAFFVPFTSFASVVRPGPDIAIYRRKDLPARHDR